MLITQKITEGMRIFAIMRILVQSLEISAYARIYHEQNEDALAQFSNSSSSCSIGL